MNNINNSNDIVAKYLFDNYEQLGGDLLLNYPPIIRFNLSLLPYNDILNDSFWSKYKDNKFIVIHEDKDSNNNWSNWSIES